MFTQFEDGGGGQYKKKNTTHLNDSHNTFYYRNCINLTVSTAHFDHQCVIFEDLLAWTLKVLRIIRVVGLWGSALGTTIVQRFGLDLYT